MTRISLVFVNGRFSAAEVALANRLLHLPRQLSGRYHLDGLFLGGSAYLSR